jgi:hypothetical protein
MGSGSSTAAALSLGVLAAENTKFTDMVGQSDVTENVIRGRRDSEDSTTWEPQNCPPWLVDDTDAVNQWIEHHTYQMPEQYRSKYRKTLENTTGFQLLDPNLIVTVKEALGSKVGRILIRLLRKYQDFYSRIDPSNPTFENLEWDRTLSAGGQGTPFVVHDRISGKQYVIKLTSYGFEDAEKTERTLVRAKREAQFLEQFVHPNILRVYAWGETDCGEFWLMTDFCERGDLQRILLEMRASFNEGMFWDWITQIMRGLNEMHQHNMLHRDLKLLNVFMNSDGTLIIGDFGLAKVNNNLQGITLSGAKLGTVGYIPPEIYIGEGYTKASDIWSVGAIMFSLIFTSPSNSWLANAQKPEVLEDSMNEMCKNWSSQKFGASCLHALQMCLQWNPQNRIKTEDLLAFAESNLSRCRTEPV